MQSLSLKTILKKRAIQQVTNGFLIDEGRKKRQRITTKGKEQNVHRAAANGKQDQGVRWGTMPGGKRA